MFLDVAVLLEILGRTEASASGRVAAIIVLALTVIGSWGVLGDQD